MNKNPQIRPANNVPPIQAYFATKGYNDYCAGRNFDPLYDTWPELSQRNYENGRFIACEGRPLPTTVSTKAKKIICFSDLGL